MAIPPDDILAMQELHLSRAGMLNISCCPECRGAEVQPIVTSAKDQTRGCPRRAVRYFCPECGTVSDSVDQDPALEPPCPVPEQLWESMRKFPGDMQPFLSRPMDADSLRERLRKLPKGKATGKDGVPYEYFIYGPPNLHDYLLKAVNAFLQGTHPVQIGRAHV